MPPIAAPPWRHQPPSLQQRPHEPSTPLPRPSVAYAAPPPLQLRHHLAAAAAAAADGPGPRAQNWLGGHVMGSPCCLVPLMDRSSPPTAVRRRDSAVLWGSESASRSVVPRLGAVPPAWSGPYTHPATYGMVQRIVCCCIHAHIPSIPRVLAQPEGTVRYVPTMFLAF